ncbi:hypothetical protein KP509_04G022600 [Ceratopteris richardii]|uniref:BSD domain-containing protein n=1 Tax=Ceratopteris richardii TaxID=49495 RepID=A0A8T2UXH6_CERRI|nr:hypothetical protein KP509_04G022600 [Ceratopteris richardii]
MSWLNRFSATGRAFEHRQDDGDQVDEHSSYSKGVKDDISELTNTFKRQLWGVASFLAPPPATKSPLLDEDLSSSPSNSPDHHFQPTNVQINPLSQSSEISLSNELVDVDFQAIGTSEHTEEADANETGASRALGPTPGVDVSSSHRLTSDHGLTGVGKDLAELKGSVATGFSKILKAVREEIDRNEQAQQNCAYDDNEEEEEKNGDGDFDGSEGFPHRSRLPVLNSFLKPLLTGILQNDRDNLSKKDSTDDELDDEDEGSFDDDPFDERGHQMSRPSVTFNLQRTLAEGNPNFEAVGVTEEVLTFARNISMHPETWLDFPLFTEDDEDDDFELSDVQKEHVHEVERALPRLAALRIELCPDYMSEGRFWKIYFVLLHSRLSKKDAMLLSTPQITEARALLLSNLQNKESNQKNTPENDDDDDGCNHTVDKEHSSRSAESIKIVSLQSAMEIPAKDFDHVDNFEASHGRHQTSSEIIGETSEEVQNKNVLASTLKLASFNYEDEEADADKWLHEESSPHLGLATTGLGNEEDVSFSDLEDDDDTLLSKTVGSSNMKGTKSWVDLNKDQGRQELQLHKGDLIEDSKVTSKLSNQREANDWLTIEDDDSDFS